MDRLTKQRQINDDIEKVRQATLFKDKETELYWNDNKKYRSIYNHYYRN